MYVKNIIAQSFHEKETKKLSRSKKKLADY